MMKRWKEILINTIFIAGTMSSGWLLLGLLTHQTLKVTFGVSGSMFVCLFLACAPFFWLCPDVNIFKKQDKEIKIRHDIYRRI